MRTPVTVRRSVPPGARKRNRKIRKSVKERCWPSDSAIRRFSWRHRPNAHNYDRNHAPWLRRTRLAILRMLFSFTRSRRCASKPKHPEKVQRQDTALSGGINTGAMLDEHEDPAQMHGAATDVLSRIEAGDWSPLQDMMTWDADFEGFLGAGEFGDGWNF